MERPQITRPVSRFRQNSGGNHRGWLISVVTWGLALLFFGPFLLRPVARVMLEAVSEQDAHGGRIWHFGYLLLPLKSGLMRTSMVNSLIIGLAVTLVCTVLSAPLAYAAARLRFAGKGALTGLLLIPLLLPPLVGAVGLRQILAREGFVNTLLHRQAHPFNFIGGAPILMITLVAALHLYPLIYLNLTAAWANIDTSLEEAAENQGASIWRVLRTVTLPLLVPGYLAGALIVFIFAFTDLGTPLIFGFPNVAAVQIFNARQSTNLSDPTAYVISFYLVLLAALVFAVSRRFLNNPRLATISRGTRRASENPAPLWSLPLIYGGFLLVIGLAIAPQLGVIVASFAHDWTSTLWPQWSLENYRSVFHDPSIPALSSIKVSLLCASLSMVIDVVAGFFLAYALVRGNVWARGALDTLAMLPLALPGLVLAFGLLISYRYTSLDPFINPLPLLIISYAVRRLPYALRSVSAGLQQMSVGLEEAAQNLGATPLQTMWQITRPLVTANLIAAGLLTFAFAVLEVSDSLILAPNPPYAPISAAIWAILNIPGSGIYPACALGVIGMLLMAVTFFCVNRILGKQLGALFRL